MSHVLIQDCLKAQESCRKTRVPMNLFWIVIFALATLLGIVWNCTRGVEAQQVIDGNRMTKMETVYEQQDKKLDAILTAVKKP